MIARKAFASWFAAAVIAIPYQGAFAVWPFSGNNTTEQTETGITITNIANDIPAFKRSYKTSVEGRAHISVTITYRSTSYNRYASGELTQPNGHWVLFDPDKVAEKIIDPIISPLIQQKCDEIAALDKAFMNSARAEFIDEKGVHWRRVE